MTAPRLGHSSFFALPQNRNVPNKQSGIALVAVLVFLLVIAAVAALKGGEELGEINLAATDTELRQVEYVAQAGMQRAVWMAERTACTGDFTIPATALGPDNYSAVTTGGGSNALFTLPADQDAWIRSDNPTNTGGGDQHIRSEAGIVERALYRFDLSALPAGPPIKSAVAWFYLEAGSAHPEGPIRVHRVTADWTEADATWGGLNNKFDAATLGTITAQDAGDVWVPVNLTGQVQAWLNGEPNYGVVLASSAEGIYAEYKSREDGSTPPRLEVVVGTGAASPLNIQATGTLANGHAHNLTRPATKGYQAPSAVELQPDEAAAIDTYLYEWKPTWNYGTSTRIWSDDEFSDSTATGLIKFNVAAIPAGARVKSAVLELYQANPSVNGGPIGVHRVSAAWDEGSATGGAAPGANWNERKTGTSWSTPGGDFSTKAFATAEVASALGPVTWDITELVNGWVSGEFEHHGLALVAETAGASAHFASSNVAIPAQRPTLTVEYACECGSACLAPQGSGNVLMVVDDKNILGAGDQLIQALLEGWGYAVTLIADDAGQNAFDVEAGGQDVIFVSESVNAGTLGTKVSAVPIGVVTAEGFLTDELGLSTSQAAQVDDTIDIVDNDHYITRVFPGGTAQFKTVATEIPTVSGTVSPDARILAEVAGAGSVVALEAGGLSAGGGNVPGRRVLVPAGEEYVSWNYMTNNGQLVIQRAIAWAMGADATSNGNVLLVVVNPNNLTAGEAAKVTLIQSFNFTVNLIDESASQANFDAAIAVNDVAYIPQEINSANLGTKLRNASIGVVNEEGELVDELGFANDKIFKSREQIDVIDVSHYITEPFATGLLTFVSSAQSVHMLNGALAPGLQTLGESLNTGSLWEPSLGTLDAGDDLVGGGTAAGRRVQLPWGGGTFDVNQLNDDGRTIMRRALEWGAGSTTVSAPIAHWPLDEAAGPTAADIVGGNDATLNGGTTWTTGTLAGALAFDGSGDYAVTDANFTPPPVGTVTFWMQVPGSPGAHGRILGLDDTWEIRHVTTGTSDGIPYGLVFDLGVSGVNTEFVTTTTVDVPGRWYHIAAAYDTTTDDYAVYIDGVPHKSGTYSSGLTVPAANPLSLGTRTGSSNFFDGVLDDVRIYDKFLTAAQIADLAAAGGSSGPVAHWKLDDGAGTTAIDSEGNNDGTLVNGPVWVAGQIGDALHFDGSNDRVEAGTFDVSGSGLTLMGWFNADTIPTSDPRIVSKANGTNEADAWWQLSAADSGSNRYLRVRVKAGGTTTTLMDSTTNLVAGQWYFAAATYNASDGAMRLYLDGVEISSATHAAGGPVDAGPAVPVWIGANGTSARYFDGVLDDIRVYDKALSASEIAELFTAGGGGGGAPTVVEVRVSANNDDAEERVSNGNMGLTSTDLELIADGSNDQLIGMRFTNVTVPNGATISNAYVQFQVDETNSGATNVTIQAQDIDDAPQFTTSNSDISSRSLTSASVAWAPVPWTNVGDAGPDQRTPDIAAVIQEVVNRPGWVSGNDIVIIITGSGERTAESHNGDSSAAPLLHIEF